MVPNDPIVAALRQPARIAWDGLQLHAVVGVTLDEIDGVIKRLTMLREQVQTIYPEAHMIHVGADGQVLSQAKSDFIPAGE